MYVASYTDRVFHQDKIFVSANALFAGKEVPGHGLPLVPITRTQSAGNDRLARHPRENLTSILDSP